MRKILNLKTILAFFVLSFVAAANGYAGGKVFIFDPPDKDTYVESVVKIKEITLGGQKRVDKIMGTSENFVEKNEKGYVITNKVASMSFYRDGQEVKNPVFDVLQSVEVKYLVDEKGELVDIKGYEKVEKALLEALPREVAERLSAVLNEETMINKAKAEWNGRIGDFLGEDAGVGSSWAGISEYELPNGGAIKYYSATKVADTVECGKFECVRIEFSYTTDKDELSRFLKNTTKNIVEGLAEIEMDVNVVELSGGGERIIEPSTMRIHSEKIDRVMKMQIQAPGQGQQEAVVEESSEFTFEYR